ncbi:MAG: hypothetical protein R2744_12020 [Bacteroidales bacterium]
MNKSRVGSAGMLDEATTGNQADTSRAANDRKSPAFYLRNLPLNDSCPALSNDRIAVSLFNAGRIFQEGIRYETVRKLIIRSARKGGFPITRLPPGTLLPLRKQPVEQGCR